MGEAGEPRSGCPINAAIEAFGDRWTQRGSGADRSSHKPIPDWTCELGAVGASQSSGRQILEAIPPGAVDAPTRRSARLNITKAPDRPREGRG